MSLPITKQNEYRVDDLETNENSPAISSVSSRQREIRVEDIESAENMTVNTSVYPDQNMCSVMDVENDENILEDVESDEDISMNTSINSDNNMYIVNLDKNQSINVNTENLKTPDQEIINIPVGSLEARNDIVDTRKNLLNFLMSKGLLKKHALDKTRDKLFVKKQRLDKTRESNKMLLYKSEQKKNLSVTDNNIKLCKDGDSTSPSKNVEIYNMEESSSTLNEVGVLDNIPDREIMLDDGILSDNVIQDDPLKHENGASNSKTRFKVAIRNYQFIPQSQNLTNDEMKNDPLLTYQDDNSENKNRIIHFTLDEDSNETYQSLLKEFESESDLLLYLMENEQMLYNKELILSKTANKKTTDYINGHLAELHKIYGDPINEKVDDPETKSE